MIDAEEVSALKKVLYADGVIDKNKVNFLFEFNDAASGCANVSERNIFFVQLISDFLPKDEIPPGEINTEEFRCLIKKIGADGKVDDVEKALLSNLKKEAKVFVLTNFRDKRQIRF